MWLVQRESRCDDFILLSLLAAIAAPAIALGADAKEVKVEPVLAGLDNPVSVALGRARTMSTFPKAEPVALYGWSRVRRPRPCRS